MCIRDSYYSKVNSKRSLDTNDFDISFAKGLSLENGTTTITDLTSELLSKKLGHNDIYVCGGGRKNKLLINSLKKKIINKEQRKILGKDPRSF